MIKINQAEWEKIKNGYENESTWELIQAIERASCEHELAKAKYPIREVEVVVDGGKIPAKGESLSEYWVLINKRTYSNYSGWALSHAPSGLAAAFFKSRRKAIVFWNKVKDMDIHKPTEQELAPTTEELERFFDMCREANRVAR